MSEDKVQKILEPKIVELSSVQFTGVERSYEELQNEENGFCTLWTKLFPEQGPNILPESIENKNYGVYRIREWAKPDSFCAAMKTDGKSAVPQECTRYNLPAATYAFFEQAPGYLCEIADMLTVALKNSGFGVAENAVCFETDAPQVSEKNDSVNIWIPVVQL
ncbi:MAG: GyrI-like domain-containing protein [Phycisphaerae bacterium]|nr:GyrI-like domain-containing protein [Phycisphaerae bacterium]